MASASGYLIDTNILLRLSRLDDPRQQLIDEALKALNRRGIEFYFSMQNIAEFWTVCTRPADRNGHGLAIADAKVLLEFIESTMTLLPDNEQVYSESRSLVLTPEVRGVGVHDARLVAIMQAFGLTHILTLNQGDFAGYTKVRAVHPPEVPLQ
jgi:predicted nucleic acid-binding protein